jgi:hypothetical protein
MILSPFTPLFFAERNTDGIECPYLQTFATTDKILIEVFAEADTDISAIVYSEPEHTVLYGISWRTWAINDTTTLYFAELSFSEGLYSISIDGLGYCQPFKVTEDSYELSKTCLLQYSNKDNKQRKDAIFFIDGVQYFFDFRVPGGFKDSNWTFSVETEQFMTDESDIVQLYGLESTQKKFTMGTAEGCPIWFGEMLNRLLCCNYVYFDGERYVRKDTSVPEPTQQQDGMNSFVFNQQVQQVNNLDAEIELVNQTILRRVEDDDYRTTNSSYRTV